MLENMQIRHEIKKTGHATIITPRHRKEETQQTATTKLKQSNQFALSFSMDTNKQWINNNIISALER